MPFALDEFGQEQSSPNRLKDLALAPVRGAAGFTQGLYGLADILTFDSLPDWNSNPLGESKTAAGGIVQGLTQFSLGFIPVLGWVGKGGKVAGTGARLFKGVSNSAIKGASGASKAARVIGQGAVAGGITDFAVFDGHEGRLSDILQQYPSLQNPVSKYLASDGDDTQFEGRIKNVLEGAALGVFADSLFLGIKGLKAKRDFLKTKPEASVDELEAAMDAATGGPDAHRAAAFYDPEADRLAKLEADPVGNAHLDVTSQERALGEAESHDVVQQFDEELQALRAPEGAPKPTGADQAADVPKTAQGPVQRGTEALKRTVDTAVKDAKLSGEDAEIIKAFGDRLGPRLLEDVGFGPIGQTGDLAEGSFNFADSIVRVTAQAVKNGQVKRTTVHEIWHSLSRFLPDEKVAVVKADFEKARAAAIQADPDLARKLETGEALGRDNYRFQSIDEWWAEELTDATLKSFDSYSAQTRGVIARGKVIFKEMISAVRAKFGYKRTQAMMNDFFNGKIDVKARNYDLEGKYSKRLSEGEVPYSNPLRRLGFEEADLDSLTKHIEAHKADAEGLDAQGALDEWLKGKEGQLNLKQLRGREGAEYAIRAFEDLRKSVVDETIPGVQRVSFSEQESLKLAELDSLLQNDNPAATQAQVLRQSGGEISDAVTRVLAARDVLVAQQETIYQQAKAVFEGGDSSDALADLLGLIDQTSYLQAELKGVQAELGRGLGALRIPAQAADLPVTGLEGLARENLEDLFNSVGGRDKIRRIAGDIVTARGEGGIDGAIRVTKLLEPTKSNRFVGILNEYFINSILSGGQTQAINPISGFFMSLYRPLEIMVGSGAGAVGSGLAGSDAAGKFAQEFSTAAREFANIFGEYIHAATDALTLTARTDAGNSTVPHLSWKAATQGDNVLDRGGRVLDTSAPTGAIASDSDTAAGAITNWVGKAVRVPSALLRGTDEWVKQVVYRARAKTIIQTEAMGRGLQGAELADYLGKQLDTITKDGQFYSQETLYQRGIEAAKVEGITEPRAQTQFAKKWAVENFDESLGATAKMALDSARDATFSTPLRKEAGGLEGVAAKVQSMAQAHPLMKMFVPFVRTPTNIALEAGRRFDPAGVFGVAWAKVNPAAAERMANSSRKLTADALSKDPRRQADAIGRLATGVGVIGAVGSLSLAGAVTGKGPSDPEQRRLLQSTGWQEYSIKVGDKWVSYGRLDPFATLLGTMADISEYSKWAPPGEEDNVSSLAMGTAVAVANNFTNKTYLQGVQALVEMLSAPDRKFEAFAKRYASALAPNFLGQSVVGPSEDYLQDVQSVSDAFLRKIPGYGSTEPLRNVLGEKVKAADSLGSGFSPGGFDVTEAFMPIRTTAIKDDLIANEFQALKHGFSPPKSTLLGGAIDLTEIQSSKGQSAYDRYQELHGEVRIGNKSLRQALTKLIKSRQYQRTASESTSDIDSPRIQMLNTVLRRYRRKAQRQLFQEFPEVDSQNRLLRQQRLLARRGS